MSMIRHALAMLIVIVFVSGCSGLSADINLARELAKYNIDSLKSDLDKGMVTNANILKQYAQIVSSQKSELKPLLTELAKDSYSNGPKVAILERRLAETNDASQFKSEEALLTELQAIEQAASYQVYNDALSDPINVIADLSDGQLSRINAVKKDQSLKDNQAKDYGPGSQLIGNPQYGHWNHSGGTSFWEWYGMYAMFSNVFGGGYGGRYYYNDWLYRRDYSYYNDYGNRYYSSNKQKRAESARQQKAKPPKDFAGKKFNSKFSRTRSGSNNLSTASKSPKFSSSNKFKSKSFGTSSSGSRKSSFGSSFRGSSSSSRGVWGGK